MRLKNPPTIVAELSKTYPVNEGAPHIGQMFEECIEFNRKRGYKLDSWKFSQCPTNHCLNETIIAVFIKG